MKLKIFETIYDNKETVTSVTENELKLDEAGIENELINIYPEVEYQKFLGFGGAFTEAAAYTLSRMSDEIYQEIIDIYFGEAGFNYTYCRTHLDSCDFALGNYSAVEDEKDTELETFTIERDEQYIIPMIRRAKQTSKRPINLMLSPWSPPAFMKTNGQRNGGGKLKPKYREIWAKYISRYIQEYQGRGIKVTSITVQNEPKAEQKWDSCIYTAEEEGVFVSKYLAPQLKKDSLSDVEIFIWDHNKERAYERAKATLAIGDCNEVVTGIGFHWYSGDHFEVLDIIRKVYPEKKLIFTEGCVEYSKFEKDDQLKNAEIYAHDIIGNLNSGMNAFIDWNLVLDEKGGPNHVENFCDAPIMCDTINNRYEKRLSLIYIGHFSKYILPEAVRIGFSRYSDKLEVTAFKNSDGSHIVVVLNRTNENLAYTLRMNDRVCKLNAKPSSIATLVF